MTDLKLSAIGIGCIIGGLVVYWLGERLRPHSFGPERIDESCLGDKVCQTGFLSVVGGVIILAAAAFKFMLGS